MRKINRKTKVIILVVSVIVILMIAGLILFFVMQKKEKGNFPGQMNTPPAMGDMGENVISASGLTSVGMSEESLELGFLETQLYVEESFLSTGDEVEAGTAIFRVSEDTLAKAEKELEDALKEADLAYRQGVLEYENSFLEAKKVYETAQISSKYAQAEYDNDVRTAEEAVETLEKQVEEARELVSEYERSASEDYYRTYYQVDEIYSTYYEHFTLLMDMYEKWNVAELKSLYGDAVPTLSSFSTSSQSLSVDAVSSFVNAEGGMSTPPEGTGDGEMPEDGQEDMSSQPGTQEDMQEEENAEGGDMGRMSNRQIGGASENEQKLSVYNLLDEMLKSEAQEYTAALENYETAKEQAAAGLEEARSNLATLEADLVQAQTAYEKELITCKATYETTLAESENAQAVYDMTCQSLQETLAALEADKEEAAENLAYFKEVLGDGSFYTEKAGTIVMNAVRGNSYLSGDTMVIAYSNPETVTISANVDQSNIADIAIDDEAMVVISEYGNYKGTVTTINPITQASSRSAVTYQVTVTLEGDVSNLESNLTAYVYFGMEMPEGMTMPGDGERQKQRGAGNEGKMEER